MLAFTLLFFLFFISVFFLNISTVGDEAEAERGLMTFAGEKIVVGFASPGKKSPHP
jgi:hypothetical protein